MIQGLEQVKQITLLFLLVILTSCASSPLSKIPETNAGRYEMANDSAELEALDLSKVETVVPVVETRTRAGNKNPYTVNGKSYSLMETEVGYEETGTASWYGRKFHGHLTSNGEIYDMFQLSAAHKTMPIPSYLRVTNLDNDKSIVVRVNDRGPFHGGRIVDLSYAAASMLDYADKGTARVKIEAIVPGAEPALEQAPQVAEVRLEPTVIVNASLEEVAIERQLIEENVGQEYLQIGAFSNLGSAENLVSLLSALTSLPVFIRSEAIESTNSLLHRVRLGPLNETIALQPLIQKIIDSDLGTPFKVRQ